MNSSTQLIIIITLMRTWKIYLLILNIMAVQAMEKPPQLVKLTAAELDSLKVDTINENVMEIIGMSTNYGLLMLRLWSGWFPLIWQAALEITDNDFFRAVAFHVIDKFLSDALGLFAVVCTGGFCDASARSVVKQTYEIVMSAIQGAIFVGIASAVFTFITGTVSSDGWVKATLICSFFLICVVEPMQLFIRRATRPSIMSDEHFFEGLATLMHLTDYDPYNISINYDDDGVPEVSYYAAIGCQGIEVNQALMTTLNNERQTLCMIAREVYYWKYYLVTFDTFVFAGKVSALCFCLKYSYGSGAISEMFGFKSPPHPIIPMFLAMTIIWPLCTDAFNWFSKLCYSCFEYSADAYGARIVDTKSMNDALVALAGRSIKYPIFDPWYSAWFDGHSNVFKRIERLKKYK